jgi:hypothetical protein
MIVSENRFPLFRIMRRLASLYTEDRKKAGKFVAMTLIYAVKGGEIEVNPRMRRNGCARFSIIKGNNMGGSGKDSKPLKPGDEKAKKPPPPPIEDDEFEDGDIATPKRDRCGDDDEPL